MTTPFEWGDELPKLSGSRVDLRWVTQQDAPAILTVFGDSDVMKYWSSPPLTSLAAAAVQKTAAVSKAPCTGYHATMPRLPKSGFMIDYSQLLTLKKLKKVKIIKTI